jgi:hypothetical protein
MLFLRENSSPAGGWYRSMNIKAVHRTQPHWTRSVLIERNKMAKSTERTHILIAVAICEGKHGEDSFRT